MAQRPGGLEGFGKESDSFGLREIDYVLRLGLPLSASPQAWESRAVEYLMRQRGVGPRWSAWPYPASRASDFPSRWSRVFPWDFWAEAVPAWVPEALSQDAVVATPRLWPWLAPHYLAWRAWACEQSASAGFWPQLGLCLQTPSPAAFEVLEQSARFVLPGLLQRLLPRLRSWQAQWGGAALMALVLRAELGESAGAGRKPRL